MSCHYIFYCPYIYYCSTLCALCFVPCALRPEPCALSDTRVFNPYMINTHQFLFQDFFNSCNILQG
jgi:hypothetical protein